MQKLNDLSRCLIPLEPDSTLIAVIKMSLSSWLVAGIVPGVERQPLKKLAVDESVLLKLLHRWREEAKKAGYMIKRIAGAFEAGRDGFWLARWLRARDIGVHVIHASSVAVSRERSSLSFRTAGFPQASISLSLPASFEARSAPRSHPTEADIYLLGGCNARGDPGVRSLYLPDLIAQEPSALHVAM